MEPTKSSVELAMMGLLLNNGIVVYIEPSGEDRKAVFLPAEGCSRCGKCYLYEYEAGLYRSPVCRESAGSRTGLHPAEGAAMGYAR